jgi:ABC-type amino acid transport substrate-binding protein
MPGFTFGVARRALLTVFVVALAVVLSACGGGSATGSAGNSVAATPNSLGVDNSTLGLISPGRLVVGMNLQFKPEMYLDEQNQPAGYDVDLVKQLAEALGLKLDIRNLDFNGLIPGLQSKKFDLVSVGLTPTNKRKQVVDFPRAYVPYTSVLAVPVGDTTAPSVAAYNVGGKVITALQGSSGEQLAKSTFPDATVTGFADQNSALLEVATGRAAGSVVEDYILAQFQRANPNRLKQAELPKPLDLSYGSWAVQKGNTALVEALNKFVCTEQNDGGLAKVYEKNFGVTEFPKMPSGC